MDSTQNIISFCTGYGGIESGIRRAGVDVRTVCNVEIETFVQANLVAKTEEGRMDDAPIYSDLKTFPAEIFRGKVHGIIGGYPCQPFSSAGKRKGEEDPRHLWPYIREHVRAVRPLWCFFENVRGHTTMGLWRVLSDLEEDGYRTEFGLYSAEETGAPHQRIRCFILGRLGNSDVRYEGSYEFERGILPTQTEDREAVGLERTSDSKQLGDTQHDGSSAIGNIGEFQGESDGTQKAFKQSKGASKPEAKLADCECERHGRRDTSGSRGVDSEGCDSSQEEQTAHDLRSETEGCCGEPRELAHTANGRGKPSKRKGRQSAERGSTDRGGDPREGQDIGGGSEDTRWPARPGEEQYEWEEPRVTEAQSELGGAVDGLTHRVDRLRLLGNGVVPQTAELAWKSLWRKMDEDNNH